jgi:hypothetical protein
MSMNIPRRAVLYAALSAGVVLAFFVLREHWAHALGLAPYLLLLACPLMHIFHHGHGGHGPGAGAPDDAPRGPSAP